MLGNLPIAFLLIGVVALAAPITPDSFGGPFCLSPAFGAATCTLSNEYIAGGLQFQGANPAAVYSDLPELAWGGVSGSNIVDVFLPVAGYIVVPNTTSAGVTNSVTVVAGFARRNNLLLEAFDINGVLLGSATNANAVFDSLDTFSVAAAGIRSFRVSTVNFDSFGVRSIEFGQITAAGEIPEPGTMSMLLGAGALLAFRLRRR